MEGEKDAMNNDVHQVPQENQINVSHMDVVKDEEIRYDDLYMIS